MPGINLYYGARSGYSKSNWYTGRRKWYKGRYSNYRSLRSNYKLARSAGQRWAAINQKDSATVVISRIASFPIVVSSNGSTLTNGAIAINHWNQLRLSEFFPNYAPMFDQMKINSIRVKITGSQAGSAMTSNISPAVVCAFDRNGLSVGQSVQSGAISTYSSAQLKQWSTGNAFVMYQWITPSTMMEKGQYLPTESLQDPTTNTDSTNPCNNLSDPTLPFKPITLLAVDMGGVSASAEQTFAFTIEFEFNVTFRGMRKPTLNTSTYVPSPLLVSVTNDDIGDKLVYDEPDVQGYYPVTVDLTTVDVPENTTISKTYTSNGTYTITPSTDAPDYDGFSSVTVDVNVPPSSSVINIFYLNFDNVPSSRIPFSSFKIVPRDQYSLNLYYESTTVVIQDQGDEYYIRIFSVGTAKSITLYTFDRYYQYDGQNNSVLFLTSDGQSVLEMYDGQPSDTYPNVLYLSKSFFNLEGFPQ